MSPDTFRACLDRLGVSYPEAKLLFGVETKTLHRWATGQFVVPKSVEHLLVLMDGQNDLLDQLRTYLKP